MSESKILGIIPARGGSKGLPGKNIKKLGGQPLINYSIAIGKKSVFIDDLIVATDDNKIAEIAKEFGADVPFLLPQELTTDDSSIVPVLQYAINYMEQKKDLKYEYVVILQPTSPFRLVEDIDCTINLMKEKKADSAVTIMRISSSVHPIKMKKVENDFLMPYCIDEPAEGIKRQDLPPAYKRNGSVYVLKRNIILNDNKIYGEKVAGYLVPTNRSVDIDNENDWVLAESMFNRLQGEGFDFGFGTVYNDDGFNNYKFNFEALSACPLCGSDIIIPNGRVRWLDNDFWYVLCPNCGIKFMNPRPTADSYRDFYKNYFWQQKIRNVGFKQAGQMWQDERYKWDNNKKWEKDFGLSNRLEKQKQQRIKTVVPHIENNFSLDSGTKVLEVGCGFGVTLNEIYEKYGSNVYAIEPSDESREKIRDFGSIKIIGRYAEELESLYSQDVKFDVIIFSHVLENIIDPLKIIDFAKKCLHDGGIIYIQTPNLLVFDQMNPYHPFIFSFSAIKFIAEKSGLNVDIVSDLIDKMLIAILKK